MHAHGPPGSSSQRFIARVLILQAAVISNVVPFILTLAAFEMIRGTVNAFLA